MRAFIAVEVPQEIRERAAGLAAELPEGPIAPVKPENMHLTLTFLGEIEEGNTQKVIAAMDECAGTSAPFNVKFFGVGVFPSESYVRVVWVGSEGEELNKLAECINERLATLGFKKEKFTSHLTIARVKAKVDLREFLEKHRASEFGECVVGKIILFKSTLTPAGPVYEPVRSATLCGKELG